MTLYADALEPLGHAVRIVLAEKDVNVEVCFITEQTKPEDLNDLNPYGTLLTLIDRELVIYEPQVMMEYLDERYPHPPLMPVDPVSRANNRQIRQRVMRDLFSNIGALHGRNELAASNARKIVRDNLTAIAPAFAQQPFFLSSEMSLIDCFLVPLLWRLDYYEIKLPAQCKALIQYGDRMFTRPAFRLSMSPEERAMRGK
ncbi:MAG: glutathione S-transferase N-terminal domain-containing protein [Gammaproteobacteria bacterium]